MKPNCILSVSALMKGQIVWQIVLHVRALLRYIKQKFVQETRIGIDRKVQLFKDFIQVFWRNLFSLHAKIEHISDAYRNWESIRLKHLSFQLQAVLWAVLAEEPKKVGIIVLENGKCYANFCTSLVSTAIRAVQQDYFNGFQEGRAAGRLKRLLI